MNPISQPVTVDSLEMLESGANQGEILYHIHVADDSPGVQKGDEFLISLVEMSIDLEQREYMAAACSVLSCSLFIQDQNEMALEFAGRSVLADPSHTWSVLAVGVMAAIAMESTGEVLLRAVTRAYEERHAIN